MTSKVNSVQSLIQQAIGLDIETLSLDRVGAIHDVALYDPATGTGHRWRVRPNLSVLSTSGAADDPLRFVSKPSDIHSRHPELRALGNRAGWDDAITAKLLMNRRAREEVAGRLTAITGSNVAPEHVTLETLKKIKPELRWGSPGDWGSGILMGPLERYDSFLAKTMQEGKFDYFPGAPSTRASDEQIVRELRSQGSLIKALKTYESPIEALLDPQGGFLKQLRGKTIWAYNAHFETKQIGAAAAAVERGAWEEFNKGLISQKQREDRIAQVSGLRKWARGVSTTSSDLQITGKVVNAARTRAQQTGDWSPVFQAILQNTGEGDLRDISDIVKAQQSYGQKLGYLRGKKPFALSVEIQARLYGFSAASNMDEASRFLQMAEHHTAIGDTALHQDIIFKQSLLQTEALEEYYKGTERGKSLALQAADKRGPLYSALKYFHATELFADEIVKPLEAQRYARMFEEFAIADIEGTKPQSKQIVGTVPYEREHLMPSGRREKVVTARHIPKYFDTMDQAASFIQSQDIYGTDSKAVFDDIKQRLIREEALEETEAGLKIKNGERLRREARRITEEGTERVGKIFARADADPRLLSAVEGIGKRSGASLFSGRAGINQDVKVSINSLKGGGRMAAMFAGGLAALGTIQSLADGPKRQDKGVPNLRILNYERWLASQGSFNSMDNEHMRPMRGGAAYQLSGFSEKGVGAQNRHMMSDFGSGYQGAVTSSDVFSQIELLDERERYLRRAFNHTHFDPAGQIQQQLTGFMTDKGGDPYSHPIHAVKQSLLHTRAAGINHSFIQGDLQTLDNAQKYGLRGKNLLRLDLSSGNWKYSMEDADTLVVKRGGVSGFFANFLGTNKAHKFRLAGIDSPETEHAGGSGYHRAQPYAVAASEAAQAMIENSRNVSIIIDPKNITYGRQVATVFSDQTNMNLELIKRGMASYLPFYKKGTQEMYSKSSYEAASNMAKSSERGMWRSPFFQAYRDIVAESGQTITFNTFTQIDKIAQNATMMSASSLMRNAEEQGFYNTAQAVRAAEIGKDFKAKGFKPNFMGDAWNEIHTFSAQNTPHKAYLSQLLTETAGLIKTKGGEYNDKLKSRNFHSLDKSLTLDTMGTSNSVWNKRKLATYDTYGISGRKARRMRQMEAAQQQANHSIFNSGVGHHRM